MKKTLAIMLALIMALTMVPALAEGVKVAKIGTVEYETLDEAIEAANDGETIELLANAKATKTFYKSLTFTGGYTVSIDVYGWRYNGNLVFDGANLSINTDINSPVANNGEAARWFTMVLGGSITAKNGAKITFTFDSACGTTCAIYASSGGVTINVNNKSKFSIIGKNTKGKDGQGIQLDSTANTGIFVTGESQFLIDGTNRGYVNSPTVYVEDSTFTVQNCTANASNGGAFTAIDSKINFLNNGGHGLSATVLEIKEQSEVTCNNNDYYGVTVGSQMTMDGTSKLTANENGKGFTGGGLRLMKTDTSGTIASGAVVTTNSNYRNGIENYGTLTFNEGVKLTVMKNSESNNGGGVYNAGTLTLPSDAIIYNNHAAKAGDDIYNAEGASITFGNVGSNWILDDCNHTINGWYDDADESRWNSTYDGKPCIDGRADHAVRVSAGKIEVLRALKAAHDAQTTPPSPTSYNGGHGHYYPTTTPVPVIVIPPKTGDMTIWQSILHFFGIR